MKLADLKESRVSQMFEFAELLQRYPKLKPEQLDGIMFAAKLLFKHRFRLEIGHFTVQFIKLNSDGDILRVTFNTPNDSVVSIPYIRVAGAPGEKDSNNMKIEIVLADEIPQKLETTIRDIEKVIGISLF